MVKTILLIEDDPMDAELLAGQLIAVPGIHLQVVEDGFVGMQYIIGAQRFSNRQTYPVPDFILLDLGLPRVSGFQFLEWLRTDAVMPQRWIPVIVISGSSEREHVNRAYALGANAYLFKPTNGEELAARIAAFNIFWGAHVEMPGGRISRPYVN